MIEVVRIHSEDNIANLNSIAKLHMSKELFQEAAKLFSTKKVEWIFVYEDDKLLFELKNTADIYWDRGKNRVGIQLNYNKEIHLYENYECLDISILAPYEVIVFDCFEEYSCAVADLIIKKCRGKRVVFKDTKAFLFWQHGEIEEYDISGNMYKGCKILYVSSNFFPYDNCGNNRSNSITVLYNLTWATNRMSFGGLNADKVVVIIDFPGAAAGMGDIIHNVQGYAQKIKKKGWVPVVRLNRDNQYLEKEEDNMWQYYFENISNISLEEALRSKNVICGNENCFTWMPERFLTEIDIRDNHETLVEFSEEQKTYVERNLPKEFTSDKKILGVIARGTDANRLLGNIVDIEIFLEECNKEFLRGNYDCLFLATEDMEYLEAFLKKFGSHIIFIEQQRVKYDIVKNQYIQVAEMFEYSPAERKEWGRKYLLITYCLSLCDYLITTVSCGSLRLANLWNRGYIQQRIVFAPKADEREEEKGRRYREAIQVYLKNNEDVVIYGTGRDADAYISILPEYKGKIIFCDKKAEKIKYLFQGIEVISPSVLLDRFRNCKVIIASTWYQKEIKKELMEMGISSRQIETFETIVENSNE